MKDLATLEPRRSSANLGPLLIMETACIRHTEIPHTSRLFSDFQYHFDRVARFYPHNPGDASSYARVAKEIAFPTDRRAELVAALRARKPR